MIMYNTYEEAAEEVDKMLMENHKALQDAQMVSKSQEDESELSSFIDWQLDEEHKSKIVIFESKKSNRIPV